MKALFGDAFYYIALLNHADQFHDAAVNAFQSARMRIVTTSAVLIEVADALSHPSMRRHVAAFLQELALDSTTEIIYVDVPRLEQALSLFAARPDKSWSLTDCLSFIVMQDRGLTDALTADQHFVQAGFRALLRDEVTS